MATPSSTLGRGDSKSSAENRRNDFGTYEIKNGSEIKQSADELIPEKTISIERDLKVLNQICEYIKKHVKELSENVEGNIDGRKEILIIISRLIAKNMIPWKRGCVKDTHCKQLWKRLEMLYIVMQDPHYNEPVNMAIPKIWGEITQSLPKLIDLILKNESPDRQIKEFNIDNINKQFTGLFKLTKMYQDMLNLDVIIDKLTLIIKIKPISKRIELCSIFRMFEILGECIVQIMQDHSFPSNSNYEDLKNIRVFMVHLLDQDALGMGSEIFKMLSIDNDLLRKIIAVDFERIIKDMKILKLSIRKQFDHMLKEHYWVKDNYTKSSDSLYNSWTLCWRELPNIFKLSKILTSKDKMRVIKNQTIDPSFGTLELIKSFLNESEQLRETNEFPSGNDIINMLGLEYHIVNLGALCKHLAKHALFEKNASEECYKKILALDDIRDRLGHEPHFGLLGDDELSKLPSSILKDVVPQLTVVKINLQLDRIKREILSLQNSLPAYLKEFEVYKKILSEMEGDLQRVQKRLEEERNENTDDDEVWRKRLEKLSLSFDEKVSDSDTFSQLSKRKQNLAISLKELEQERGILIKEIDKIKENCGLDAGKPILLSEKVENHSILTMLKSAENYLQEIETHFSNLQKELLEIENKQNTLRSNLDTDKIKLQNVITVLVRELSLSSVRVDPSMLKVAFLKLQ